MHTHGHSPARRDRSRRRLAVAIAISSLILAVEAVGGILSHSLALLADAGHVLTDVATLMLSYIAARFAERATSPSHTFGLYRAEILAAFINAQVLLIVCAGILYEAYARLRSPEVVHPLPMLIFGVAALAGNLTSTRLLHAHQHDSLNIRGAYLEVATDALASLAVIVAALLITRTGWHWIDSATSVLIAIFIFPRTLTLLRQSAHILLEGAPPGIDQEALTRSLTKLPGILSVHDIHLWTLTSGIHYASLHAAIAPEADETTALENLASALHEAAGIDHATIQIERRPLGECATPEHH